MFFLCSEKGFAENYLGFSMATFECHASVIGCLRVREKNPQYWEAEGLK